MVIQRVDFVLYLILIRLHTFAYITDILSISDISDRYIVNSVMPTLSLYLNVHTNHIVL